MTTGSFPGVALKTRPATRTTAGVMRTASGAPMTREARPHTAEARHVCRRNRACSSKKLTLGAESLPPAVITREDDDEGEERHQKQIVEVDGIAAQDEKNEPIERDRLGEGQTHGRQGLELRESRQRLTDEPTRAAAEPGERQEIDQSEPTKDFSEKLVPGSAAGALPGARRGSSSTTPA